MQLMKQFRDEGDTCGEEVRQLVQQQVHTLQSGLHALDSCQLRASCQLPWCTLCPTAQQLF